MPMPKYRVVDLRSEPSQPEQPEAAAMLVLQEAVIRRGGKRSKLLCRVYWESGGSPTMVRFYRAIGHPS